MSSKKNKFKEHDEIFKGGGVVLGFKRLPRVRKEANIKMVESPVARTHTHSRTHTHKTFPLPGFLSLARGLLLLQC